jgi:hypothetical protein
MARIREGTGIVVEMEVGTPAGICNIPGASQIVLSQKIHDSFSKFP